ncbi:MULTISPECIES: DUF29 domain-containing protein [Crocosphaera]|uniref:DUF29 domain-containing protein n=3 Tax=Crocosphaera watsonii TaxID=263511 RepID=T2JM38_CROWT|nr:MULTISPECIES: DUF29 domain-containing protein [Crocosphaera]EHJ14613.1 hypothetical protein CWATWH0003_0736 [Crocosphaera watsonii WH 0003]MCH2244126.1 DUF29 domain-containing protein [Crocosphaera sp.]NQZ63472.1 DUF29 domain-containing protein [Crocosphaera sp.]CCQ59194.1 hypothetical protein CWATWH0005_2804 [Crocosphaera watsonii WH 0005]CCQ66330.1 hypothetical protein CWATWH0402_3943 [Crocosphaera watsonii WH 0402]
MKRVFKPDNYETDYYQWTLEQVEALRERNLDKLDWENIIEEIESLGRSDYNAVSSLLMRQIEHRLKIDYTPLEECYKKWQVEIQAFKIGIKRQISPSMKPKLKKDLEEIYQDAVSLVTLEYGINLPDQCPYTLDELLY